LETVKKLAEEVERGLKTVIDFRLDQSGFLKQNFRPEEIHHL
jgi:hypothetical protein